MQFRFFNTKSLRIYTGTMSGRAGRRRHRNPCIEYSIETVPRRAARSCSRCSTRCQRRKLCVRPPLGTLSGPALSRPAKHGLIHPSSRTAPKNVFHLPIAVSFPLTTMGQPKDVLGVPPCHACAERGGLRPAWSTGFPLSQGRQWQATPFDWPLNCQSYSLRSRSSPAPEEVSRSRARFWRASPANTLSMSSRILTA